MRAASRGWLLGAVIGAAACERPEASSERHPLPRLSSGLVGGDGSFCLTLADGRGMCAGGVAVPPRPRWSSDGLVEVPGLDDAVAIAVAHDGDAACALRSPGTVACWGEVDDAAGFDPPAPVAGIGRAVQLVAAADAFCALDAAGGVDCWGGNETGVADPTSSRPRIAGPGRIAGLPAVTAIGGATTHVCALTAGGAVWCWGDVPPAGKRTLREIDADGLVRFRTHYAAPSSVCAEARDGTERCLGLDGSFELQAGR